MSSSWSTDHLSSLDPCQIIYPGHSTGSRPLLSSCPRSWTKVHFLASLSNLTGVHPNTARSILATLSTSLPRVPRVQTMQQQRKKSTYLFMYINTREIKCEINVFSHSRDIPPSWNTGKRSRLPSIVRVIDVAMVHSWPITHTRFLYESLDVT